MNYDILNNHYVGLIKNVNIIKNGPNEPNVYMCSSEIANMEKVFNIYGYNKYSGGAGFTIEEAKCSAVGELIERYCSAIYDKDAIIYGSYKSLLDKYRLVNPKDIALYSYEQYNDADFPYSELKDDTVIGWTLFKDLSDSNREILVPGCFCFLPYFHDTNIESVISPSISTGLACGESLNSAIINGIYESVERDAFTIMWLNQLKVKKIIFDSSKTDYLNKFFKDNFVADGFKYNVYDITNDLNITTIFTILEVNTDDKKIITIGAASNLNPALAVIKSIKEAIQGKSYVVSLIEEDLYWKPKVDFSNVDDFSISAKLYTICPELQKYLFSINYRITSYICAEKYQNNKFDNNELCILKKIMNRHKYHVYYKDLTTCDIKQIGLRVVRVFISELQKLHANHMHPFLGGKRLLNMPIILGQSNTRYLYEDYKRVKPHPFP